MEIFTKQIDLASASSKQVIILGDANLCMFKWDLEKFIHKNTAEFLISSLEQNGLTPRKLGHTFTSDIIQKSGNIATSAIDHIYVSKDLEESTITSKLNGGSSDHVPIVATISRRFRNDKKMKTITNKCNGMELDNCH